MAVASTDHIPPQSSKPLAVTFESVTISFVSPRILSMAFPCRRCPLLYIGETGTNLRSRFSEHLRSISNNTPGFPVAQHFNSTGHSISDVQVRGVALRSGTDIQRKQCEMRLIFQLGTVQPKGLNIRLRSHPSCMDYQNYTNPTYLCGP